MLHLLKCTASGSDDENEAIECEILADEILQEYFDGVARLSHHCTFLLNEASSALHTAKSAKRICRVRRRVSEKKKQQTGGL